MRTALAVLMAMLCASGAMAQPSPADAVPFDHWAYDAAQLLRDALANDFAEHVPQDRALTRYEFGMLALQATRFSLIDADAAPTRPTDPQAAAVWRRLAREFLPELEDLCEDVLYLRRDHYDGAPPLPGPPIVDSGLGDMATLMLHQMPGDHWLYAEVQRLLWMAPDLKYSNAPPAERHPADTVPFEHWAYQAMFRAAPLAFPGESDRALLAERACTRYEFAMFAWKLLGVLSAAQEPVHEPEAAEVTWALLAVEFWPEFMDLAEDVEYLQRTTLPGMHRVGDPPEPARPLEMWHEIPPNHWMYETVQRVLEIVEGNDREGA